MSGLRKWSARGKRYDPAEHYPRVDLFEWRPAGGAVNFGDHLATVVVTKILSDLGFDPGQEVRRATTLFSVGSVLHFAQSGDVVWGSGVNGKIPLDRHRFRSLDVRAVRGPRTAEYLVSKKIRVPEIYGDPALLIPRLFPDRFKPRATYPLLFVPNLNDRERVPPGVRYISPLRGWNRVLSEIVESELVVASSLHGLILAEAFGIPARYLRLSEEESPFKYLDYFEGTGRTDVAIAGSIEAALEMGGAPPVQFDADALLEAFPRDLWD